MTEQDRSDFSTIAAAVGIRIEQERVARRMTKEDLSAKTGIDARYIWRLEAGRQNVTLKVLVGISQGLGLPLSVLLEGVEKLASDPPARPRKKPRGPTAAAKRAMMESQPD